MGEGCWWLAIMYKKHPCCPPTAGGRQRGGYEGRRKHGDGAGQSIVDEADENWME